VGTPFIDPDVKRVEDATHSGHVWNEAQNIGGANSWGRVDVERDFEDR